MMQVRASTVLVDKDKGSLLPRVLDDGFSALLGDKGGGVCCSEG